MNGNVLTLILTIFSTICSISVSAFVVYISFVKKVTIFETKLDGLTKQVEKHNNIVERTYKLEQQVQDLVNEKR